MLMADAFWDQSLLGPNTKMTKKPLVFSDCSSVAILGDITAERGLVA